MLNIKIHGLAQFDGYKELTFMGERVRLAFEFNGYQHYRYPNFFHKTYFLVNTGSCEVCKKESITE